MTNEEAYRILMSYYADFKFSGTSDKSRLTADALCCATDALDKQIPKKPKSVINSYTSHTCHCGSAVGLWNLEHDSIVRTNYCGRCGQAIDWSKE